MNYLSEKKRLFVLERASYCCEYCLLHRDTAFWKHEIDHIISTKHEGSDDVENLASACFYCNRNKGTDVGSIYNGDFIRFFNPRIDVWSDHFRIEDTIIEPLTPIGFVTAKILGFNQVDRVIERQILIQAKKYPPII
jgi:HNH endonuclease